MESIIVFFVLLLVGIIAGGMNERNHFRRLDAAEKELSHIVITNLKVVPDAHQAGGNLVTGNVVIAVDYFKRIAAAIRIFFGGELRSYQTLLSRARREAIVRMKRQALSMGADQIHNVRIEFSAIGSQPEKIGGAELLAYGTAIKSKDVL